MGGSTNTGLATASTMNAQVSGAPILCSQLVLSTTAPGAGLRPATEHIRSKNGNRTLHCLLDMNRMDLRTRIEDRLLGDLCVVTALPGCLPSSLRTSRTIFNSESSLTYRT